MKSDEDMKIKKEEAQSFLVAQLERHKVLTEAFKEMKEAIELVPESPAKERHLKKLSAMQKDHEASEKDVRDMIERLK